MRLLSEVDGIAEIRLCPAVLLEQHLAECRVAYQPGLHIVEVLHNAATVDRRVHYAAGGEHFTHVKAQLAQHCVRRSADRA